MAPFFMAMCLLPVAAALTLAPQDPVEDIVKISVTGGTVGADAAGWIKDTGDTITKLTLGRAREIYSKEKETIVSEYDQKIAAMARKYKQDYDKARELLNFAMNPPKWKTGAQDTAEQLLVDARRVNSVEFQAEINAMQDNINQAANTETSARNKQEKITQDIATIKRIMAQNEAKSKLDVKQRTVDGRDAGVKESTRKLIMSKESATKSIKTAKGQVNDAKDILATTRKNLGQRQAQIVKDKSNWAKKEEESSKERSDMKEELTRQTKETEGELAKMEAAKARVNPALLAFQDAQEQVDKVVDSLKIVEANVKGVRDNIANVNHQKQDIESKMQTDSADKMRQVRDMEQRKEDLTTEVSGLKGDLGNLRRGSEQAKQVKATVDINIKKEKKHLESASQALDKAKEEFTNKQELLVSQRRKLISENSLLKAKLEGLNKDADGVAEDVKYASKVEKDIEARTKENVELLKENEQYQADQKQIKEEKAKKLEDGKREAKLKEKEEEITNLKKEILEFQANTEDERKKAVEYKKKISSLKTEHNKYMLQKASLFD